MEENRPHGPPLNDLTTLGRLSPLVCFTTFTAGLGLAVKYLNDGKPTEAWVTALSGIGITVIAAIGFKFAKWLTR